jgi:glycosyltransferase involved in cell wall biosynthesis
LVVGRSPAPELKRLCESINGIELYANVSDIRSYYKKCKAVIVPLLIGGGTRIKILEAALANRPVLSTPLGAEGLNLVDGTGLLLFENPHDFFVQYNKLLERDRYDFIARNAKEVVLTQYSARRFNNAMEKVLNELELRKH